MNADWVENEFSTIDLGDARVDERAKKILNGFEKNPGAPIAQAFKGWKEIKACYRFFDNARITPEKILVPHSVATIKRIKKYPLILMVSDSTSGDYTGKPSIEGLGRLAANQHGNNLGIFLHSTLAVTPERLCLGVVGAKIWTRPIEKNITLSRKQKESRPIEEKETYRWIESYNLTCEVAEQVPKTQIVNITDREGDFIDLFAEVISRKKRGVPYAEIIVRSKHDRCLDSKNKLTGQQNKLREDLKNAPDLGTIEFFVPQTEYRSQRTAKQTIKSKKITIKSVKNQKIEINAVMVIEENPPEGEEALTWILLTTLPISNFKESLKVIEYYLCRWEIEIFHKVLKSGCKIEEKQLQTGNRLKALIALFCILAWRVQYLMMLGRSCPKMSSGDIFEECEWKSVYKISNRNEPIPSESPPLGEFIKMIAMLGGYIGRANDPPPGPKVMWKGLSRMKDFSTAWEVFVGV